MRLFHVVALFFVCLSRCYGSTRTTSLPSWPRRSYPRAQSRGTACGYQENYLSCTVRVFHEVLWTFPLLFPNSTFTFSLYWPSRRMSQMHLCYLVCWKLDHHLICCFRLPNCWPLLSCGGHILSHKCTALANLAENVDVVPSLFCLGEREVSFHTHTS